MSNYDNDPRVRVDPDAEASWIVTYDDDLDIAVVRGDDGVFRTFVYLAGGSGGDRHGREIGIPGSDFDAVVREMIGPPRR